MKYKDSRSEQVMMKNDKLYVFKYRGDKESYMKKLGFVFALTGPNYGSFILINLNNCTWEHTLSSQPRISKNRLEKWVRQHPVKFTSLKFGI